MLFILFDLVNKYNTDDNLVTVTDLTVGVNYAA